MLVGPIIIVVLVVVVLPVMFLLTGAEIAAIDSYLLPGTVDAEHEGSELIELNR